MHPGNLHLRTNTGGVSVYRRFAPVACYLAAAALVISMAGTGTSCASIVPPTGGPKDTLPPVLVNASPADSTLSFTGNKIVLNFDEFVQIDNPQQNMLISPVPKTNPVIQVKLRTITVQIKDTLEENTTYSFDFGKTIKDINEGNVLRNYRYLLSTGPWFDSLSLAGKVTVAETGKFDSTLKVLLYTNFDDSAVVKEKPRYMARVDSSGNFRFRNLPADTFAIYALKDEGGGRYMSKDQLFGFYDSAVTSASGKDDIHLYAFIAKDTAAPSATRLPPKAPAKGEEGTDTLLRLQTNLSNSQLDLLSNLELNFVSDPVQEFDSTKLVLMDENYAVLSGYSFLRDTGNRKITLVYPWVSSTSYNLLLDSAFATDTSGRRLLKTDTLHFQTKKSSEYGLLRLRFQNLPLERSPLLLFIQGGNVVKSQAMTTNQFFAPLFQPGEYELRLVFDENGNGEWDTGEFFGNRRQPEKVQRIDSKLIVRPNWDNEVNIQL